MDDDPRPDIESVVRVSPHCASCVAEMRAGVDRSFVRPAQWAVTLKDCCHGWTRRAHLVCHEHFHELIDQRLPAQCPVCSAISRTVGDVVDTAMTLGGDIRPSVGDHR